MTADPECQNVKHRPHSCLIMRQLLIVTFDLIRDGEPSTPFAVGCLMSYLKNHKEYGYEFVAHHISFNLHEKEDLKANEVLQTIAKNHDLRKLHAIAIGCYVWADFIVKDLVDELRKEGYKGKIILGGYQISRSEGLEDAYPGAQIFIMGYAEESLIQSVFAENTDGPIIACTEPDFSAMPSPYLSGEIIVKPGQGRVRLETKRGCPFKCAFCAHADLHRQKVYGHPMHRILDELAYLKVKSVKKINVIDPVFNFGDDYLAILRECYNLGIHSLITLQTSFHNIRGKRGEAFLELCSALNVVLEFGAESIHNRELAILNKPTDLTHTRTVLRKLLRFDVPYEVNLLYGLPLQTVDSFKSSVSFFLEKGCRKINAFPLMLLNGTQLWDQKDRWECKESYEGRFRLPVVTSSDSFEPNDWEIMRGIAGSLRRKGNRTNIV